LIKPSNKWNGATHKCGLNEVTIRQVLSRVYAGRNVLSLETVLSNEEHVAKLCYFRFRNNKTAPTYIRLPISGEFLTVDYPFNLVCRQLTFSKFLPTSSSIMGQTQSSQLASSAEAIPEESKSTPEEYRSGRLCIPPSCYFRFKVDLSLREITQPAELHINVCTTSAYKEINLSTIYSMVIRLPTSSPISDRVLSGATNFLVSLSKTHLNVTQLDIAGFPAGDQLLTSLSSLHPRDLYLTCPLSLGFAPFSTYLPKLEYLNLKLEKNSDLQYFPQLPSSLKSLVLHFSNLCNNSLPLSISNCTKLETL
jgi:hypothetical protein